MYECSVDLLLCLVHLLHVPVHRILALLHPQTVQLPLGISTSHLRPDPPTQDDQRPHSRNREKRLSNRMRDGSIPCLRYVRRRNHFAMRWSVIEREERVHHVRVPRLVTAIIIAHNNRTLRRKGPFRQERSGRECSSGTRIRRCRLFLNSDAPRQRHTLRFQIRRSHHKPHVFCRHRRGHLVPTVSDLASPLDVLHFPGLFR